MLKYAVLTLSLFSVSARADINPASTQPALEELKAASGPLLEVRWETPMNVAGIRFGGPAESCSLSRPDGPACLARRMSVEQTENLYEMLMPRLARLREAAATAAARTRYLSANVHVQIYSERSMGIVVSWNVRLPRGGVLYAHTGGDRRIEVQFDRQTRSNRLTEVNADAIVTEMSALDPKPWSLYWGWEPTTVPERDARLDFAKQTVARNLARLGLTLTDDHQEFIPSWSVAAGIVNLGESIVSAAQGFPTGVFVEWFRFFARAEDGAVYRGEVYVMTYPHHDLAAANAYRDDQLQGGHALGAQTLVNPRSGVASVVRVTPGIFTRTVFHQSFGILGRDLNLRLVRVGTR